MKGHRHINHPPGPPPPPTSPGPQEAPSGHSKIFSQNSHPFHPLIVNQQLQLDFSVFTKTFLLWNDYRNVGAFRSVWHVLASKTTKLTSEKWTALKLHNIKAKKLEIYNFKNRKDTKPALI